MMTSIPIEMDKLVEWNNDHHAWSVLDNKLMVEFTFDGFNDAVEFMNEVVIVAQKHNHHPTIENTFNVVKLSLNTHDAGNVITDKDLKLAEDIEKIKE